ncbi:MAG: response regulator transcription factor [Candidatus Afipia apatlaquensis]|uniref:Response regulator transcription factor n=1 Tax=Candidatus Afipia apatlaquensis TaxID=2712852 RepID=A0A7C9VCQ1_9BRAD|nr:response regulator transcription factor [Candidatus Afipia apatlaquensis]
MRCVRVVIADRNPLILQGLADLLNAQKNFKVIAACVSSSECIQIVRAESPDIALIETMFSIPGLDILAAIASASILTRVVFFAASAKLRELISVSSDASYGLLLKDTTLVHCLRHVAAGQRSVYRPRPDDENVSLGQRYSARADTSSQSLACLTEREREIMHEISKGFSNKEAARRLNISEGTVKIHLHHIYHKLSIRNRAALVAMAITYSEPTWLMV